MNVGRLIFEPCLENFAESGQLSRFSGHHDFANGRGEVTRSFVTRQDSCANDVCLGTPVNFHCDAKLPCLDSLLPGMPFSKTGCQQHTLIDVCSDLEAFTMVPQHAALATHPQQGDQIEIPKLYKVRDPSINFPSCNSRDENTLNITVENDFKVILKDTLQIDDAVQQRMTSSASHLLTKSGDLGRKVIFENKESQAMIQRTLEVTTQVMHVGEEKSVRLHGLGLDISRSENHWKKGWLTNLVWILALLMMAATLIRLQVKVDILENRIMAMTQKIEEMGQAQIHAPSSSKSGFMSTDTRKNKSTSYSNGYTGSLTVHREDPINNISEYDKPDSDLHLSTNRENQIRNNARQNFPANAASAWDFTEDERQSGSAIRVKQPPIENVNRRKNIIERNERETDEVKGVKDGVIDLKSIGQSQILLKRRFKRNATSEEQEEMDKYCKKKVCKDKKDKSQQLTLPMEKFVGDFYHVYDYKKDFLDHEGRDCFEDSSLSTKPVVCKEATFQYPRQDSVLAFYRHVPGNKCKGKRCGGPLLELTGPSNETFRVRTPGIYTLSVNITIVDEKHNHSLALFLNGHAVLACPKGGFRCPKTNEKDSVKYRICNINGLVELNDNDILQLRTLERNTTVRLESHRQSLFEAVLLHQTGEAIKKKANKQKANDPQKKRVT